MNLRSTTMPKFLLALVVVVVVISADVVTSSTLRCSDDELDEAQKSFRNCVDSAKAGIVSRHAQASSATDDEASEVEEKQQEVPPLCDELVSLNESSAQLKVPGLTPVPKGI